MTEKIEQDGGGERHNEGKPRFSLMPPDVLLEVARVFTKGADKYKSRNWERGQKWTVVLDSLHRHLNAFERGEDVDPESELHHLTHIIINGMFLLAYQLRGLTKYDDRPSYEPVEEKKDES